MLLCHSKHFEGTYMKNLLPELMLPVLLVVLGICLCMATGCTSDSSDTPLSQGPRRGVPTRVSFGTLMTFLPDAPAGWTAEGPSGTSWTVNDDQWTMASHDYAKGDATVLIGIQDLDLRRWHRSPGMVWITPSSSHEARSRATGNLLAHLCPGRKNASECGRGGSAISSTGVVPVL